MTPKEALAILQQVGVQYRPGDIPISESIKVGHQIQQALQTLERVVNEAEEEEPQKSSVAKD